MSDEIKIIPNQISVQANNAVLMMSAWKYAKPRNSWTVGASAGKVADQMKACLDEAKVIHQATVDLLSNTVEWCKTVKVNFETTDNA